jgi:hypothetical protein
MVPTTHRILPRTPDGQSLGERPTVSIDLSEMPSPDASREGPAMNQFVIGGAEIVARREASINDVPIDKSNRRIHGPRPATEHGILLPVR